MLEWQKKVLNLLGRFASLDYSGVRNILLFEPGVYSYQAESDLRLALQSLMADGRLISQSIWGPYRLASQKPGPAPGKRPGVRDRLETGGRVRPRKSVVGKLK